MLMVAGCSAWAKPVARENSRTRVARMPVCFIGELLFKDVVMRRQE
jgi:hypothetical protein